MKIKQLCFTQQTPSSNPSNKITSTHQHTRFGLSYFPSSRSGSPYLKNHSNKRLKYYSTRNRQESITIDDENINVLKEQFKKISDNTCQNFAHSLMQNRKDVFNLIAKKYYNKNKTIQAPKNAYRYSEKYLSKGRDSKLLIRNHNPQSLPFQDNKMRKPNNLQVGQIFTENFNLCSQQNQLFHTVEENFQKLIDQQQRRTTERCKQFRKASRKSSIVAVSKYSTRNVLVNEERLNKHRFNQSSISNHEQKNLELNNKINNFIDNTRKFRDEHLRKKTKSAERSYSARNVRSKRYVKVKDNTSKPQQIEINPYTHKKYLHFKSKTNMKS